MWNKREKASQAAGLWRCYQNIFWMLGRVMKYTPGYLINYCLFQIYCGIQVFFEFTVTMKVLLDMITEGAAYGEAVAYLLVMLAMILIKLAWVAWMDNVVQPRAQEVLHRALRMELYEKANTLDLEQYDNPEYYNEFVWSINEASTRVDKIILDFAGFLSQIARIVAGGIFFVTQDAMGLVFILFSLVLTLVLHSMVGRVQFARDVELKPLERKRSYFNRIFYLNDYAKEIRLNPVADRLQEEFTETNNEVYHISDRYGRKNTILGFLGDYGANDIIMNGMYLTWLMYRTVVVGALSYGSTMALFSVSSSLKNVLRNAALMMPKFEQHGLYVEKIRSFLAYESQMEEGDLTLAGEEFAELSVKNISFAYPGAEDTLHDISFEIRAGEKIAIVGYNGAGKSTLIKLLLRLYDVKQGEILLNGRNIKEYIRKSYGELFATVFQDYKIFATSIGANVKMNVTESEDSPAIREALEKSDFGERLSALPRGIETPLTREFDENGVNLSGGEAQKVAVARTFFKYCPIIILDEPSSALDPISEYQLNHAMLEAAENKTVIFISHRLSSTVAADRIYMLENGHIIETGSHKELMARNGKYAEMFRLQAEKYNIFR